jgi:phosphoglycerate dehydrogenase-like enzyme
MKVKSKTAILIKKSIQEKIFANSDIERLKKYSEVDMFDFEEMNDKKIRECIRNATAIVGGWESPQLTGDLLDEAPDLKILAYSAGSVKNMVSDELWEREVIVTTGASSLGVSVAEYTLGLIITSLARVYQTGRQTAKGLWRVDSEIKLIKGMHKQTIGIVGAGFVGRNVLSLLKNFDVNVLLCDPFISESQAVEMGAEKAELDFLMKSSDLISLHAPSIPETNNMINKNNLKLMKENAILINTARGSLINEADLCEALKSQKIFAMLDVTEPEPPSPDNPLFSLDNVIVTPHIAGKGSDKRLGEYAVDELERFFLGRPNKYVVKREMLQTIA